MQSTNVTLRQTEMGELVKIGRPGHQREVKIDREWEVSLGGQVIGRIRYAMIRRERGRRPSGVVNRRWHSPGWSYSAPMYGSQWVEAWMGKQHAIDQLVLAARPGVASNQDSEGV